MACSRCLILGDPLSGKTAFITQYLYSFTSPSYIPTTQPKQYKYTISYPSPSKTLEIIESRDIPNGLIFSSVIIIYDPTRPESLYYAQNLINTLRKISKHAFGCAIVASVRGNEKVFNGKKIADEMSVKFMTVNVNNRMSVKRCFGFCWKWTQKNLIWESRKNALAIREGVKSFRLA
ncbi:unnamed protein product [Blepharisma stoltei]|uniref:Uncharacterized protein n=1 Tax=Blepharisma stoltei TaxID=1481888 RepID=A0AAU9IA53_9CILI|nr:unnamed protein product [Blepharisma stoltei]